jgi:serine phosphatase RsbU (regulator of sigma subunit)/ActR/RegA family two-component response regulator
MSILREVADPIAEPSPVVLIVDDEPAITTSLRSFFALETNYVVHAFQSPRAALDALPRIRPDIVISDFLMAEMDGIRFLGQVRKFDSDIPLVLLTGYADKESAIRAINEIGLYQYVEKPWDNDALKLVVQNGLRQQSLARTLRAKIGELHTVLTRLTSLQARDELLRGELEMARRIQQSLLPAAPPTLPGLQVESHYLPLIEVGGDFFDFHSRSDGQLSILIADVAGHGIQAALVTAMVKTLFLECASSALTPAATLNLMSSRLSDLLPVGRFVTGIAVSVQLPARRVRVANAGHPPPYLLSSRRRRIEPLAGGSLPLAVLAPEGAPPYADLELVLDPGDRLLLYTDGLPDLASPGGDRFGDLEMLQFLERAASGRAAGGSEGASSLGALVLGEARRFADGQVQADDINIITLTFDR